MDPKPTPRHLMLHIIAALLVILAGVIWLIVQWRSDSPVSDLEASLPHVLVLGGFAWYVITRLRIWRHQR
ncbi:hypothetical protein DFR31_1041 [Alkalispirillum mobile]|uniref:Uncharacterized protein n=1 Tax=Alkalispirillum mobile TaxID=85925 RepID=A0A498C5M7_9GAMM|nr:hypothetical protein [Alkalispirillum mobile]RLK51125.1 hypothetical protein DFR31_1041 [Alkalispirillum mobile]